MDSVAEEFYNSCHGKDGRFCSTGGRRAATGSKSVNLMKTPSAAAHRAKERGHSGTKVTTKSGFISRLMERVAKNAQRSATKTAHYRGQSDRFVGAFGYEHE